MVRLPPKSPRTDTLFPYTTLFLSAATIGKAGGRSTDRARRCRKPGGDKGAEQFGLYQCGAGLSLDRRRALSPLCRARTRQRYRASARRAAGGGIGDRKSVVSGKSVSVRVDTGGRRICTKKQIENHRDSQHNQNI